MAPTTRSMRLQGKKGNKQCSTSRTSERVHPATNTVSIKKKNTKLKNQVLSVINERADDVFPIDLLPEWVLVHVFSFLSVKQKCRLACVSTRWKFLIHDPRLWRLVTDSPEDTGDLLKFIRSYLGKSLWCFRPNTMTTAGLRLLESQCPNLKYLLVEFNDKTLHHFVHLDIDYLPHSIDKVIIKATRKSSQIMGSSKGLVFYLIAVRDFTNLKLPVDDFDDLCLFSKRQRNDEDDSQDVNLQLFRLPNII